MLLSEIQKLNVTVVGDLAPASVSVLFFFFQAEDGIRDLTVTGVQTCALPISLLVFYVASRYRVANANEALIVAGSRGAKVRDEKGKLMVAPDDKGVKVVVGGGTFVMPLVHRVGRLKLTVRQIDVVPGDAVTSQGIKVK